MFLASKIVLAGITLSLLTTGMLVQGFPGSTPVLNSDKKEVAAFVAKDEVKKMQQTLHYKGHYQGEVDGVFGLRTRASIRAYQKAENLLITGQVDSRTADRLGVRPESSWDNSTGAGRPVGRGSNQAGESKKDKPSACIPWAEGGARKSSRKEVSRATAIEDNRADGINK